MLFSGDPPFYIFRVAEQGLTSGRSVVVDNTHVDLEARRPFLDVAKRRGVPARYILSSWPWILVHHKLTNPIRCFFMSTSHDHARHNNIYRELTDPSHTRIKEPLFNHYR